MTNSIRPDVLTSLRGIGEVQPRTGVWKPAALKGSVTKRRREDMGLLETERWRPAVHVNQGDPSGDGEPGGREAEPGGQAKARQHEEADNGYHPRSRQQQAQHSHIAGMAPGRAKRLHPRRGGRGCPGILKGRGKGHLANPSYHKGLAGRVW